MTDTYRASGTNGWFQKCWARRTLPQVLIGFVVQQVVRWVSLNQPPVHLAECSMMPSGQNRASFICFCDCFNIQRYFQHVPGFLPGCCRRKTMKITVAARKCLCIPWATVSNRSHHRGAYECTHYCDELKQTDADKLYLVRRKSENKCGAGTWSCSCAWGSYEDKLKPWQGKIHLSYQTPGLSLGFHRRNKYPISRSEINQNVWFGIRNWQETDADRSNSPKHGMPITTR